MRGRDWSSEPAESQLAALCADAGEVGVLVVRFASPAASPPVEWRRLEPWTRTRAVTVADVRALRVRAHRCRKRVSAALAGNETREA